jgi:hypothetical protein
MELNEITSQIISAALKYTLRSGRDCSRVFIKPVCSTSSRRLD